MSRATPQMRNFAERVIAHEARENKSSGATVPAGFRVGEKLRPHLASLMGNTGFHGLLARAVVLASADAPWLRAVRVREDGSLDGWEKIAAQVDPKEMADRAVLLVAQLLGLLVAFIGENLTLQLVREAWPKLSLDDLDFGKGDKK